ncbi:hypothetical protein VNO77_19658 [Canavalia gladiata]|uniref:Uncharacterized protein n=1 Tax=Canavalia gladiata TaxID=3824 RepID=A0AAN9QKM9_CANGL
MIREVEDQPQSVLAHFLTLHAEIECTQYKRILAGPRVHGPYAIRKNHWPPFRFATYKAIQVWATRELNVLVYLKSRVHSGLRCSTQLPRSSPVIMLECYGQLQDTIRFYPDHLTKVLLAHYFCSMVNDNMSGIMNKVYTTCKNTFSDSKLGHFEVVVYISVDYRNPDFPNMSYNQSLGAFIYRTALTDSAMEVLSMPPSKSINGESGERSQDSSFFEIFVILSKDLPKKIPTSEFLARRIQKALHQVSIFSYL